MLAHAMLSIPATKGFEIGSGFEGTKMYGHQHNDPFVKKGNRLGTLTNRSGGIQGGISNGECVYFRLAFKPPATIGLEQKTADYTGNDSSLEAKGRHDPCVVPRAVPIVEAMAALVMMDALAAQASRMGLNAALPSVLAHHQLQQPEQPQQLADGITADGDMSQKMLLLTGGGNARPQALFPTTEGK